MEDYIIVTWPESQELMVREGFEENSELIIDTTKFGPAAYFVNKSWYEDGVD